jgi:hypothetical protein
MKKILAGGLLICSCMGFSQQYYNDAQLRVGISVEKKIKRFSVYLQQQDRITNNVSTLSRISGALGMTYKLSDNVKLYAEYALIQKRSNLGIYTPRNWYALAVLFKKDYRRWKFSYRNKLQLRRPPVNRENSMEYYLYDRNKVTVKFDLNKRFGIYVAEEVYVPLNSPLSKGIERSRSYTGLLINTTRSQQLEFYFMFQAQLQRNDWYKQKNSYPGSPLQHYFVYGITYNFQF